MVKATKFSLTLKQIRMNSGLTQKQVAAILNMDRSTYSYYEIGVTHPNVKMVLQLAKIFNVDYNVFIEAISDELFDNSKDGNKYTTLNEGSWEERDKMYQLEKTEQDLILRYRGASADKKERVMSILAAD